MSYLLPLFPLPNSVIFPREAVHLHIFEPRYRAMIEFAVEQGDRLIGMCRLRDGYEREYFGNPPLHRVLTASKVVIARRLPDGRWLILVQGVERVRLMEEVSQDPFRLARVAPLQDVLNVATQDDTNALIQDVVELARTYTGGLEKGRAALDRLMEDHPDPAARIDILAALLVEDSYARQSLLSELDVHRRAQLVQLHARRRLDQAENPARYRAAADAAAAVEREEFGEAGPSDTTNADDANPPDNPS